MATRPLPVRNPRAVAPPGASLALPACPSFEPPSIADRLRASLHPLSDLSSLLRPIRVASSAPYLARQSVAQLAWHPRPPVVSSLPSAPGGQTGLGAPSLSAEISLSPVPSFLNPLGYPRPPAWPPGSRHPWSVRQIPEASHRQSGWVAPGLASLP